MAESGEEAGLPVEQLLAQAVSLHRQNRLAEAESLYRRVILQSPRHFDALHMLGVIEYQNNRPEQSIALIERALDVEPAEPLAHVNLGNALLSRGRFEAARASYERACVLRPDFAKALYGQGVALQELNRLEEALACYDDALVAAPGNRDALHNRAIALKQLGRCSEALAAHAQAVRLDPERALSWIGFSECLVGITALSTEFTPLLLPALRNGHTDPQNAQPFATEIVCRESCLQEWLQDGDDIAECARRMEAAIIDGRMRPVLEMPLLLALLEETIITSYKLEQVMTALRRALLSLAVRSHPALDFPYVRRFVPALAVQCFANDYLYDESAQELELLAGWAEKLRPAADHESRHLTLSLAILGAYRPLHALGAAREFAALLEADADSRLLALHQLRQPAREADLKPAIPRITEIDDAVSNAVRMQYEENPYPRWRRRRTGAGLPFKVFLKRLFPTHEMAQSFPLQPEILVAGCGTGAHAVQTAHQYHYAQIFAADLSLASLAYARRATEDSGLMNVEYVQADILGLSSLNRQFDIVESAGVLHHLSDPLAGARVLTQLLRPGGYMYLALYSRAARREISAVREFIRERGYPASAEGIRRCRRALMSGEYAGSLEVVLGSDFFSLSGCRDLLFHVQEHLFTPLQIADLAARLGLEFLGFQLQERATELQYLAIFPHDTDCTSLANWEDFERIHPTAFYGMYRFWLRKPAYGPQSN